MVHFLESVSCALYWAKNELNTDNSYTSVNSHDSTEAHLGHYEKKNYVVATT